MWDSTENITKMRHWKTGNSAVCLTEFLLFVFFSLIISHLGNIVTLMYIFWLARDVKGGYGFCFYSAIFRHNHFVHGTSVAIYGNAFFFEQMGIIKTTALKCGTIQDIKHFLQSSRPSLINYCWCKTAPCTDMKGSHLTADPF